MQKNKLFYLFNALSPAEIQKLGRQLKHPFFQGNDKVLALYKYLVLHKKELQKEAYEPIKQGAYNKIYAKEKANASKFRSLMSSLYTLIEDFVLLETLRKDKLQRQDALLNFYKDRNLDRLLIPTIEQKSKQLEAESPRDMDFHLKQLQLAHLTYFHPKAQKYKEKDPYVSLTPIQENLDSYYLLAKLRYSSEVLAIQLIRGKQMEIPMLEEVLSHLKKPEALTHPLLPIYQKIIALLKAPDKAIYLELKQDALEALPLLSAEGQHNLLVTLLNVAWFSMPNEKRTREFFDLNLIGMERDILLENKLIAAANFINIVDIGCALKEFAQVRKFVQKYSANLDLDPITKENIGTLVDAFLFFGEKKYEEVLRVLNYLEYEDFSYGLRAHKLLIRSHYEVKGAAGYREVEMRCEAFKQYVIRKYKRHYLSKAVRDEQLNFIKIVLQLPYASDSRFARISKENLLTTVQEMSTVANKPWLLAKIEALR